MTHGCVCNVSLRPFMAVRHSRSNQKVKVLLEMTIKLYNKCLSFSVKLWHKKSSNPPYSSTPFPPKCTVRFTQVDCTAPLVLPGIWLNTLSDPTGHPTNAKPCSIVQCPNSISTTHAWLISSWCLMSGTTPDFKLSQDSPGLSETAQTRFTREN